MVSRKTPGQLTKREKYRDLKEDQNARDLIRDAERDIESLRKWMDLVETSSKEWGGDLTLNDNLQVDGDVTVGEYVPDSGAVGSVYANEFAGHSYVAGEIPLGSTRFPGSLTIGAASQGELRFPGFGVAGPFITGGAGGGGAKVTVGGEVNPSILVLNEIFGGAQFGVDVNLQGNDLIGPGNLVTPTGTTRSVALSALMEGAVRVSGSAAGLGTGTATFLIAGGKYDAADFPDAAYTYIVGNIRVPEPVWLYGTNHTATITLYWAPTGADTGNCLWDVQLGWPVKSGITIGTVGLIANPTALTAAGGVAGVTQTSTLTTGSFDWTATGTNTARTLSFRIARSGGNPSDTFLNSARLIGWEVVWNGDFAA